MTKPFEPKELIFRIKALLRRYEVVNEKMIVLNSTSIDRKSYEVHCSGRLFILPMKEFELLAQLASYPGRIFTREELIHLIWGADFNGDNRTIDVHVKGCASGLNIPMILSLRRFEASAISLR